MEQRIDQIYNETAYVDLASLQPVMPPPACSFPDLIDSSPKNLILCLIYFIGTSAAVATAFYLYLKDRKNRNGHQDNQQSSIRTPSNKTFL